MCMYVQNDVLCVCRINGNDIVKLHKLVKKIESHAVENFETKFKIKKMEVKLI